MVFVLLRNIELTSANIILNTGIDLPLDSEIYQKVSTRNLFASSYHVHSQHKISTIMFYFIPAKEHTFFFVSRNSAASLLILHSQGHEQTTCLT